MYKRIEHVSLNFSEHCNLKCRYCYISHSKFSMEKNEVVREKITNKSFIEDIKGYFGDEIKSIGLWGSEPTLNLDVFAKVFPDVLNNFKKLESIHFSTNLSADENICKIKYFLEEARKIYNKEIRIQVSVDGPESIHTFNRGGDWGKLLSNIEELNRIKERYEFSFGLKGTYDQTSNRKLLELLKSNAKELAEWKTFLRNNNLRNDHTIVIPGTYTKEDGEIYSELLDRLNEAQISSDLNKLFAEMFRAAKSLSFDKNYLYKFSKYFGCHAGESCFGVNFYNDTITYCQQGFSINKDEKLLKEEEFFDKNGIKFGEQNGDSYDHSLFIEKKNSKSLQKFYAIGDTRNKNFLMKYNFTKSLCLVLAQSGLISPRYLADENLLNYFVLFNIMGRICIAGNIFSTGNFAMVPEGVLKLYGNGAFEKIYDKHKNGVRSGI